jgi:hypothetical protein
MNLIISSDSLPDRIIISQSDVGKTDSFWFMSSICVDKAAAFFASDVMMKTISAMGFFDDY